MERRTCLGATLSILVMLCVIFGVGMIFNQESQGDTAFEYYDEHSKRPFICQILAEDTVEITKKNGYSYSFSEDNPLILPSKVQYEGKEYIVTGLGYQAFYNNTELKAITLPDTLKKIGNYALSGTGIISIHIPDSVTEILPQAFSFSLNLNSVRLPEKLEHLQNNVFRGCERLQHIKIPDNVTFINNDTFADCITLETVILPKSLDTMGSSFYGCEQLRYIYIPENARHIDWGNCFPKANLETIEISEKNPYFKSVDGMVLTKDGKALVYVPVMKETVTVPDGVVTIGARDLPSVFSNAFRGNNLKVVHLPESVEIIEDNAFDRCENLDTINLPDSIHKIGFSAFYNCKSLNIDRLPSGLKTIGYLAFGGCTSIEYLIIPYGVESVGRGAFSYCTSLKNLELPDSVTTLGTSVFDGCASLVGARLPDKITTVGEEMFDGCTSLRSIVIPDHVVYIGEYAFRGCESLTSIEFPQTLTSYEYYAFDHATDYKPPFYGSDGKRYGSSGSMGKILAGRTFVGEYRSYYEISAKENHGYLITFNYKEGSSTKTLYSSYVKADGAIETPSMNPPDYENGGPIYEFSHWKVLVDDVWNEYSEGMNRNSVYG